MKPTMPNDVAHSNYWQTSDVVFGGPFLLAIALGWVFPISLPQWFPRPVAILMGIVFIGVGIAFIILARRELTRQGQPTDPGRPTSRIVTAGVFSISRNPLYFGVGCVLVGITLALNLPWVLILLPVSLVACYYVLIAREERYLAARFGEEYSRYTATVRRWLGRTRVFRHP
jgi:protein-S-isoprenylcysteine O-methyltransferase Ste14